MSALRRFVPANAKFARAFTQGTRFVPQQAKIVATIGPTSEQMEPMQKIVASGMRVMRLNFSHATVEEADMRIKHLKACKGRRLTSDVSTRGNLRAVLLDTQGPEIRTGKLAGDDTGKKTVQFEIGEEVLLRTDAALKEAGSTAKELFISYPGLAESLAPREGQAPFTVLLDDGAIALTVQSVDKEAGSVLCTVDNSGELRSRAGVNLPNAKTNLPPMSDKDRTDIKYGIVNDVDYVAASFVRDAAGVREIRSYIRSTMDELGMHNEPPPLIISKIENTEALENFSEILEASDGIMVARGDLGVEIPIHDVTNWQKRMVAECNKVGKPVIVATQMLESMAKNPRPTRAEVADVTNAVHDGADCVMLSGETAKGRYPVESVDTMNEIIKAAELFEREHPSLTLGKRRSKHTSTTCNFEAIASAAVTAAEQGGASAIIVLTRTGYTARLVSKYRPTMPILCFAESDKVGRQLMVHRGCHPYVGLGEVALHERPQQAIRDAKAMGFIDDGSKFVIVTTERQMENDFITMRIGTAGKSSLAMP